MEDKKGLIFTMLVVQRHVSLPFFRFLHFHYFRLPPRSPAMIFSELRAGVDVGLNGIRESLLGFLKVDDVPDGVEVLITCVSFMLIKLASEVGDGVRTSGLTLRYCR